jgi:spoIIIJ-associated protein
MRPGGTPDNDRAGTTMSNVKIRFFSGDTLQQALVQAANHYHVEPEQIAYRSIEKKHGFLKARRKVVIEVDPEAPRRAPAASPAVPSSPPRPAAAPVPAAAEPPRPPVPAPVAAPAPIPIPAAGPGPDRPSAGTPAPAVMAASEVAPDWFPAEREARTRPEGGERPERRERPEGRERRDRDRPERRDRPEPMVRTERSAAAIPAGEEGLVTLPERPRSPGERFPVAEGPAAEAAQRGIALLLDVAGLDLTARVLKGEERLVVELSGKDADRCFEDEGEILLAFEHLLPRIIRTLSGEGVLCRVDCENFHEIREEQLRTLAQRIAGEVRRRQRPRTLEPMNPADRRVVHMTLADDPGVVTESEGDGYFKRVTIRPV